MIAGAQWNGGEDGGDANVKQCACRDRDGNNRQRQQQNVGGLTEC